MSMISKGESRLEASLLLSPAINRLDNVLDYINKSFSDMGVSLKLMASTGGPEISCTEVNSQYSFLDIHLKQEYELTLDHSVVSIFHGYTGYGYGSKSQKFRDLVKQANDKLSLLGFTDRLELELLQRAQLRIGYADIWLVTLAQVVKPVDEQEEDGTC